MPFNAATGVYTAPAAATNAFPGKVIASADWNAIFTDESTALTQLAQNTQPVAGAQFSITNVDFNAGNTDHSITVVLPANCTRYRIDAVIISHASHTLVTATAGLFTAAGGGGTAIVTAASAITVSATAEGTVNNLQSMTINNQTTTSYNNATLFFRVATAEGVAATGDVTIRTIALP